MNIYTEDEAHRQERLKQGEASLKDYVTGTKYFTSICADVLLINQEARTIYLAKRRIFPMKGWWVIGGRKLVFEYPIEAVKRNVTRELGLEIYSSRFQAIGQPREFYWKERRQAPHELGRDDVCFWFSLELKPEELVFASKNLSPDEYEKGGLKEFGRKELLEEKVHASIVEAYDEIFK